MVDPAAYERFRGLAFDAGEVYDYIVAMTADGVRDTWNRTSPLCRLVLDVQYGPKVSVTVRAKPEPVVEGPSYRERLESRERAIYRARRGRWLRAKAGAGK